MLSGGFPTALQTLEMMLFAKRRKIANNVKLTLIILLLSINKTSLMKISDCHRRSAKVLLTDLKLLIKK